MSIPSVPALAGDAKVVLLGHGVLRSSRDFRTAPRGSGPWWVGAGYGCTRFDGARRDQALLPPREGRTVKAVSGSSAPTERVSRRCREGGELPGSEWGAGPGAALAVG